LLMPEHPDWEKTDSSGHQEALQLFANHLEQQMGGVRKDFGRDDSAIQRICVRWKRF